MTLVIRKWLYAVLGSGAIFSGGLALIGFFGAIGVFFSPPADMGLLQRVGMLLMAAGCIVAFAGAASGFVAIFSLPVSSEKRRRWLTAGVGAGVLAATAAFISLLGDGDEGATMYFCGMPAVVGAIVLVELWWPVLRGDLGPGR